MIRMVTATFLPPVQRDQYGDVVPGSDAPFDVPECSLAPRYSTESGARGRQGVVVGSTLYVPGVVVTSTMQVRVGGVAYEVEGEPGDWGDAGVEVALRRAEG